jgi:hypothetical protein
MSLKIPRNLTFSLEKNTFFRFMKNQHLWRTREAIAFLVSLLVSIAGFLLDWYAFAPGFMSPDTVDQFSQAANNKYGDWHPPVLAGVWHLLNYIYFGSEPMLFLQLSLMWFACFILMRVFWKRYGLGVLFIPVFFCALFVQNFAGNIWKDVHLAFSWLLASTIILRSILKSTRLSAPEAIISIILLAYGCWTRPNGFPGVFPLCICWLIAYKGYYSSGPAPKWRKIIMQGVAITVAILLMQSFISKVILKAGHNYIEFKLFAHDLTGIYVKTGQLEFPPFILQHPGFDTAYIRAKYDYTTFDNIWWNTDNKGILPDVNDEKVRTTFFYWLRAIIKHPITYLKIRARGFLYFLRIFESGSTLTIKYPKVYQNRFGIKHSPNGLCNYIMLKIEEHQYAFYFKPYFWLFANILLLFASLNGYVRRVRWFTLCLLFSSLFFLLFEFLVFPADTEFRYFYWNCIAVSVSAMLLVCEYLLQRYVKRPKTSESLFADNVN